MTESTRKLSNLKIQWTKTLYQNNFKYIAFFLHFQGLKIFGARENNVKFRKITPYTLNFQNFNHVLTILEKFEIHFLGLPWEICFGVITSWALEKCKNVIFFKLFCYKVFVHWKLKLLNFLVDSVLIF